jgi:hypothetical protein
MSEVRARTNRAPLAQLRDVDEAAWKVLMAAGSTADPDFTTTVQSIAATLMGAHDLAQLIRDTGFYPLATAVLSQWPDWTVPALESQPCDHDDWSLVEDGYQRSWYTSIDDEAKVIHAGYHGASDWSDDGDSTYYLQCGVCVSTRPLPDGYEIDWK